MKQPTTALGALWAEPLSRRRLPETEGRVGRISSPRSHEVLSVLEQTESRLCRTWSDEVCANPVVGIQTPLACWPVVGYIEQMGNQFDSTRSDTVEDYEVGEVSDDTDVRCASGASEVREVACFVDWSSQKLERIIALQVDDLCA